MRNLLESYGCTLNKGEAEELKEELIADGQTIVNENEKFDRAIIFTCGVIEQTQKKMLRRIGELAGSGNQIIVCGCLGAICESEILKLAPQAIIFTPGRHPEAAKLLCAKPQNNAAPSLSRGSKIGILPIATGCLGNCTYCITKIARGELASRSPDEIIQRAKGLVRAGAAEIQLTAQDTGVYGRDIDADLPNLLNNLMKIEGDFMIRVGMMTPNSVINQLPELLDAFESPKIFKFLHLPVQSGDDKILKSMGRKYTVSEFENTVEKFRARYPNIFILTDIIAGFPGETDGMFENSVELMKRIKPDSINITRFSPRPGTGAIGMKPRVPGPVSKHRSRIMTDARFIIAGAGARALIGTTVRALAVEYRKPGTTILRTQNYRPIVVDGEQELGKWLGVKITGHEKIHYLGQLQ